MLDGAVDAIYAFFQQQDFMSMDYSPEDTEAINAFFTQNGFYQDDSFGFQQPDFSQPLAEGLPAGRLPQANGPVTGMGWVPHGVGKLSR